MITNMKYLSSFILLVLVLHSCEKPEVANPADPNYKLQVPVLISGVTEADTAIVLSWQNTEEYTREFLVNRKSGSSSYGTIATVSKDVLSYVDTSFSTDVSYSYVVQSKVSKNLSENSNILATEVALVPSGLTPTIISDSEILLSWTDNCSFEEGYHLERDSGTGYTRIADLDKNISSYPDSALTLGKNYFYRIAAFTNNNSSAWLTSNATATTFPAPTNLSVTAINDTSVAINWTDNCNFEEGYRLERDPGSGYEQVAELVADVTEYTDIGLAYNSNYSYRVAGFTSNNISSWEISSSINIEFPSPSNLQAIILSESQIYLRWNDNSENETGYRIERDSGNGFVEICEVPQDVIEYFDNDIDYETDYIYRVAGFTSNNISSWETSSSINIEFPAPSNLRATIINDSQIQLTWDDNSYNEDGFRLERDSGAGFELIAETSENETEYIDGGLESETSYSYRVNSFTSVSNSEYSDVRTFGILTDQDGNMYITMEFGDQVWMVDNLKVTHYRDGTEIQFHTYTSYPSWYNLTTGAYSIYNSDTNNLGTYGALYNWYAVADTHIISPEGWHVPTDAEWMELEIFLGMDSSEVDNTYYRGSNEGSKLAGTAALWNNGALKNDPEFSVSEFTALPSGCRTNSGNYFGLSDWAFFWTATDYGEHHSMRRVLYYDQMGVQRLYSELNYGFSIRCVRD